MSDDDPKLKKPSFHKKFQEARRLHQDTRVAFLVVAEKQVRYVYDKYDLLYEKDKGTNHAYLMYDGWMEIQMEIQKKRKQKQKQKQKLSEKELWELAWKKVCVEFDAHFVYEKALNEQSRGKSRTVSPDTFTNAKVVSGTSAHSIPHSKRAPHVVPQDTKHPEVKSGSSRSQPHAAVPSNAPRHQSPVSAPFAKWSTAPASPSNHYSNATLDPRSHKAEDRTPSYGGQRVPHPPARHGIMPTDKTNSQRIYTEIREPGGRGAQMPPPPVQRQTTNPAGTPCYVEVREPGGGRGPLLSAQRHDTIPASNHQSSRRYEERTPNNYKNGFDARSQYDASYTHIPPPIPPYGGPEHSRRNNTPPRTSQPPPPSSTHDAPRYRSNQPPPPGDTGTRAPPYTAETNASMEDAPLKEYYSILGLEQPHPDTKVDYSDEDIKKAYCKLATKHHPDKNRGDPEKAHAMMAELNEAKEALDDAKKRGCYEAQLILQKLRQEKLQRMARER